MRNIETTGAKNRNLNNPDKLQKTISPKLMILFGVIAVSTASTLIRIAQIETDSLAIAAWRLVFASLIISPFALTLQHRELRNLTQKEWVLIGASGVFLAIHFASWITSLAYTSVAASVVLVTTYPLFVGILSHFLFKEKLRREMIIGLVLAMGGTAVIGLGDTQSGGSNMLLGDALAIIGSLSVGGYFLIGRNLRKKLSLLTYIFPVYTIGGIVLLCFAFTRGVSLTGFSMNIWLLLLLLALVPQVLGHSLLNWALRHLSATSVTVVVVGEPIGSALLALFVLNEVPSAVAILGSAVILIGIVIALRDGGMKN